MLALVVTIFGGFGYTSGRCYVCDVGSLRSLQQIDYDARSAK